MLAMREAKMLWRCSHEMTTMLQARGLPPLDETESIEIVWVLVVLVGPHSMRRDRGVLSTSDLNAVG